MKSKLLTIVLLVSLALVQSCSKSSTSPSLSIVGTWKLITEENYNCPTSTDNKVYTCGTYTYCQTYIFKADKTFTVLKSSDNSTLWTGTYISTGTSISLSYSGSVNPDVWQILLSANTFVHVTPGGSSCSTKDTYQKQ